MNIPLEIKSLANSCATSGWGLSAKQLMCLWRLITENNIHSVLEFGSGQSTKFLEALADDLHLQVISVDHDPEFAHRPSNPRVHVIIRPLGTFQDVRDFAMSPDPFTTRGTAPKNTFYCLKPGDIGPHYDLCILDGPFGDGRRMAFYRVHADVWFIDDASHYPFVGWAKEAMMRGQSYWDSGLDHAVIFD